MPDARPNHLRLRQTGRGVVPEWAHGRWRLGQQRSSSRVLQHGESCWSARLPPANVDDRPVVSP